MTRQANAAFGGCGFAIALTVATLLGPPHSLSGAEPDLVKIARQSQRRVVKIYGAGGIAGLEAYQSGFLVSPDGHVATVWSYVLDVDPIVVLDDGRRFESEIVGFEPALELAVLKIDASGLDYFPLPRPAAEANAARVATAAPAADLAAESTPPSGTAPSGTDRPQWGDSVLAISNLFGIATGEEPASVMQGRIAAISSLDARRGTFKTTYRGRVFLLDLIANNPGAAGGAVVGSHGQLVGMLGKELRDTDSGAWLNYALPADVLRTSLGDIIAGRATSSPREPMPVLAAEESHALASLGITLVPDVLESTPAFVDRVSPDTPAAESGLRPDDLILMVGGRRVESQRGLIDLLRRTDRRDDVELTVQRGSEIVPVTVRP